MTAAELRKLAILIVEEQEKRQDKVLNESDLKQMFGIKNERAIRHRIDTGVPIRHKKGFGYYAFEREIFNYLKS